MYALPRAPATTATGVPTVPATTTTPPVTTPPSDGGFGTTPQPPPAVTTPPPTTTPPQPANPNAPIGGARMVQWQSAAGDMARRGWDMGSIAQTLRGYMTAAGIPANQIEQALQQAMQFNQPIAQPAQPAQPASGQNPPGAPAPGQGQVAIGQQPGRGGVGYRPDTITPAPSNPTPVGNRINTLTPTAPPVITQTPPPASPPVPVLSSPPPIYLNDQFGLQSRSPFLASGGNGK